MLGQQGDCIGGGSRDVCEENSSAREIRRAVRVRSQVLTAFRAKLTFTTRDHEINRRK